MDVNVKQLHLYSIYIICLRNKKRGGKRKFGSLKSGQIGLNLKVCYQPKFSSLYITCEHLLESFNCQQTQIQLAYLTKGATRIDLTQYCVIITEQDAELECNSEKLPDGEWLINVLHYISLNHCYIFIVPPIDFRIFHYKAYSIYQQMYFQQFEINKYLIFQKKKWHFFYVNCLIKNTNVYKSRENSQNTTQEENKKKQVTCKPQQLIKKILDQFKAKQIMSYNINNIKKILEITVKQEKKNSTVYLNDQK
ncbi:unnamed protein product [Paramecium octaurelia]|uniref:Uncharacterized protein n=1 Tax=Paramecium octaurelia TaxID=43137 RepID=A0A8S1SR98_PAROT|nr:unnamed protein product [Paramecium octaurelia]